MRLKRITMSMREARASCLSSVNILTTYSLSACLPGTYLKKPLKIRQGWFTLISGVALILSATAL